MKYIFYMWTFLVYIQFCPSIQFTQPCFQRLAQNDRDCVSFTLTFFTLAVWKSSPWFFFFLLQSNSFASHMNPCASFCSFPSVKWCVIFSPMAITAVHKRPVKQAKLNGHWWNEPLWLGPAARLFLSWLNHGGRRRWLLRRRLLSHQIGHCDKNQHFLSCFQWDTSGYDPQSCPRLVSFLVATAHVKMPLPVTCLWSDTCYAQWTTGPDSFVNALLC